MKNIPHEKDVAPPYGARRDHATAAVVGGQTVLSPARAAISAHVGGRPKAMAPATIHPSMTGGNRGYPTKGQPAAAPIDASPNTGRPTPVPPIAFGHKGNHDFHMANKVIAQGFAQHHNRLPGEVHHSTTTPQAIIAAVKKTLD